MSLSLRCPGVAKFHVESRAPVSRSLPVFWSRRVPVSLEPQAPTPPSRRPGRRSDPRRSCSSDPRRSSEPSRRRQRHQQRRRRQRQQRRRRQRQQRRRRQRQQRRRRQRQQRQQSRCGRDPGHHEVRRRHEMGDLLKSSRKWLHGVGARIAKSQGRSASNPEIGFARYAMCTIMHRSEHVQTSVAHRIGLASFGVDLTIVGEVGARRTVTGFARRARITTMRTERWG